MRENKAYKFGLLGRSLRHSFSKTYFANKFKALNLNASYINVELDDLTRKEQLVNLGLDGFNVTIPYKEKILPFLDAIDGEASQIGAVNTVKIGKGGRLKGYNTDVIGFETSLKALLDLGKGQDPNKALILGTGGAAKAVAFVLQKLGISYEYVSRKQGYLNYKQLSKDHLVKASLIINTTPLGTAPKLDQCPSIPYLFLGRKHLLFDLIYNPDKTLFLAKGEAQGAEIKNGYEMLEIQAEKSWEIWTNIDTNKE